ncbi:TSS-like protein [Tanacetum coccineum]
MANSFAISGMVIVGSGVEATTRSAAHMGSSSIGLRFSRSVRKWRISRIGADTPYLPRWIRRIDIRRIVKLFLKDKRDDDFFKIDLRVSGRKPMTVIASRKGLYPARKRNLTSHSLVGLLQQISRNFDAAYKSLMKAFINHNKILPLVVADNPSVFPPLPVEEKSWGGNGGGQGRDGKHDNRKWAKEFLILAAMPCKTAEERQIRDRKAFLLHNLFVNVSVLKAVATIKHVVDSSKCPSNGLTDSILHEEKIRDLLIKVTKDVPEASTKLNGRNDGNPILGLSHEELAKRNLLKGITADESATVHDTSTLGVVATLEWFAVVKVAADVNRDGKPNPQDIDIEDQPKGGTKALNVNRSLLMHLQNQNFVKSDSKKVDDVKVEPDVKGLGKGLLKESRKTPKVADFSSFELSPVDGRTLTDFMHTRGLRMCSLGRVVTDALL